MGMKFPPNRGREHGYIKNMLLGQDAGVLGPIFGIDFREPISSWCWRKRPNGWARKTIDWVFAKFGELNHCERSAANSALRFKPLD